MLTQDKANILCRNLYADLGLCGQPELVRLGENAVFRDRQNQFVIRIYREHKGLDYVQREIDVTRYLVGNQFPAPTVSTRFGNQPKIIGGYLCSIWEDIGECQGEINYHDFGVLVKNLHQLLGECPVSTPLWNPIETANGRMDQLRRLNLISDSEESGLNSAISSLTQFYREYCNQQKLQTIHGDCHRGNLLLAEDKTLYLLDYEHVATGPLVWDLMPTALAHDRFGLPLSTYEEFVSGYGVDPRSDPAYFEVKALRELTMVTWLMQNRHSSKKIEAEVLHRLHTFLSGDQKSQWTVF